MAWQSLSSTEEGQTEITARLARETAEIEGMLEPPETPSAGEVPKVGAYELGATRPGGALLWLVPCSWCRRFHQHGASPGLRTAHCDPWSGSPYRSYDLFLVGVWTPEVEREHRRQWRIDAAIRAERQKGPLAEYRVALAKARAGVRLLIGAHDRLISANVAVESRRQPAAVARWTAKAAAARVGYDALVPEALAVARTAVSAYWRWAPLAKPSRTARAMKDLRSVVFDAHFWGEL